MPGLLGTNTSEIELMSKELLSNNEIEQKDTFSDDIFSISQVSLAFNNFKKFEKDNIVIFVDGFVYNIEETNKIMNIDCATFQEQLFECYKNKNLEKLLNKTDGYFAAVLYDKFNKKILLISDRFGTRFLYWYFKDGIFAFSGEVKGLLPIKNLDKTIDNTSIDCFINGDNNFYLFEDNTFFEYIKLLRQSTIFEYDISNNKISQRYYWKFSDIKQSDISYEDAIDKLHELVEKAILKRIKNLKTEDMYLPLSGGLDSRLILAVLDKYDKIPDKIYTIGADNCLDVKIARILCEMVKKNHNNFEIKEQNYIETRETHPYITDGMIHLGELNLNMNKKLPIRKYQLNGYLGDMIMGGSFKKEKSHIGKRMDDELAQLYYGKYKYLVNYKDDYFDTPHIEASLFMNRVRRFTNQMLNEILKFAEPVLPYIDNDLIDFVYSIPDSYRENNNLYADMLIKHYPKFYKNIPHTPNGLNLKGKNYKNFQLIRELIPKIENCKFITKKFKKSILKRINPFTRKIANTFHIFYNELQDENNIKIINEKYINNDCLLKNYISADLFEICKKNINERQAVKTSLILTIEFYLRGLKNHGYL